MKALLDLVASFFRWLANRNEPEAIKDRKDNDIDNARDKAVSAVENKDEDKVNAIMYNALKVLLVTCLLTCSCARTRTVYVPESDKIRYHELDKRAGWWVPEKVFVRMIEKLAEAKKKE